MLLRVQHQLLYSYSEPVMLDPHVLYLHPLSTPFLRVKHFDLQIIPKPTFLIKNLDAENNIQFVTYYQQATSSLAIMMEAEVENTQENPFDFIVYPFDSQQIPFDYPDQVKSLLQPYLIKDNITPLVQEFAQQVLSKAKANTLSFLLQLNQTIFQNFAYEVRDEGIAQSPETTLQLRKGSCRDFVVLYMAVCRTFGLAARLVSGYSYSNADEPQYLHAWAEVYLPGAGWRGYDPTQNCMAADSHIPLAASASLDNITPVRGVYRGLAQSSLLTLVKISQC